MCTENGLLACLGHSYLFSVSQMRGDMGDTLWNSFQETEMKKKTSNRMFCVPSECGAVNASGYLCLMEAIGGGAVLSVEGSKRRGV